ncbi:MAG: HD domain-containing phosphohydrolase [Ghiorsea sp.]|nr:HD domain-containing phosphohydrolase [Ghiorsea sp.]
MSKYIDLLREHQTKSDTTMEQEKIQTSDSSTEHNPYRNQATSDANLLDNMELLLEELNTSESNNEIVVESVEETQLHELMTTEPTVELATHEPNTSHAIISNSHNMAATEDEHDFHIPSWLEHVKQLLKTIFVSVAHHKSIDLQPLEKNLAVLFDHMVASPNMLDHLELELKKHLKDTIATSHDPDLLQKSVMMMLYSIKVGSQLKRPVKELLPCTIAAMLQHIGMAMIADSTREKVESLSDHEVKQINNAKSMGLDYLSNHQIQHKQLIAAISYGDERYDGSGPQGFSRRDIPWVARLTSLLSTFEALVHFRPYRTRLFPRDAIRHIVNHHKKEFDPIMLKALIESMSLYPVGTYIQLNTGEIGQVVSIHSRFPLRPVVDINMDKDGHVINKRQVDLSTQTNLMIQKCLHKEDVLELTEGLKDYA